MLIFHGTWVPACDPDFDNHGQFIFWVETSIRPDKKNKAGVHPTHLSLSNGLADFLSLGLPFGKSLITAIKPEPVTFYAVLPGVGKRPLPSLEMAQLSGDYLPDDYTWSTWTINGIAISRPLLFLRELQFLACFNQPDFHLGNDLIFWTQYAQQLRNIVRQHQFLPVMKCYRSGRKGARLSIYAGWSPAAGMYERGLRDFAASMPIACTTVNTEKPKKRQADPPECLDRVELLRHFSEQQVESLVADTAITKQVLKQLGDSWLVGALGPHDSGLSKSPAVSGNLTAEQWKQWRSWQKGILGQSHVEQDTGFVFGIRLHQVDEHQDDDWRLGFFVASSQDPSLKVA